MIADCDILTRNTCHINYAVAGKLAGHSWSDFWCMNLVIPFVWIELGIICEFIVLGKSRTRYILLANRKYLYRMFIFLYWSQQDVVQLLTNFFWADCDIWFCKVGFKLRMVFLYFMENYNSIGWKNRE